MRFAICHPERKYHCKGLCSTCYGREQKREFYKQNPDALEKRKKYRQNWAVNNRHKQYLYTLRHKYKIEKKEFDEIIRRQEGKCGICKNELKLPQVDHCHKSMRVRGILCGRCNKALGLFQEDIGIVKNAILYLILWSKNTKFYD